MNRVILIGRLTRDPELRYTQSGLGVARFTLAIDRPYVNQQGQREADFIDVSVWRKQAETVSQYLKKGSQAAVEGSIRVRSYEAQDGQKRRAWEVVADRVQFLDRRGDGTGRAPSPGMGEEHAPIDAGDADSTFGADVGDNLEVDVDEVPF